MKNRKPVMAGLLAVMTAILLVRAFAGPPEKDDEEETVRTASRISVRPGRNGTAVIRMGAASQSRIGIETARLGAVRERREITAPAVVLPVEDLARLAAGYAQAGAALGKAEIRAGVSRREYERLKTLYGEHQNVSEKVLESAEGAFQSDQADTRLARESVELATAQIRESWGERVAGWVTSQSPELSRALNRRDALVEVTLPEDASRAAPSTVTLGPGELGSARLVSWFPRLDPRIQGASFLYVARAGPELAPGRNLIAHLAEGHAREGVVVPASAVIWWQGEAWIYRQSGAGEFARQAIPTSQPDAAGYFVTEGLRAGDKIVVRGPEELLSEELNSQIQPED